MFHVEDLGTLILIRPLTDDVAKWLKENVAEDAHCIGNALVVEPRYLALLVEGMFEEGSPSSRTSASEPARGSTRNRC